MLYALVGIPLMFIYMANIGTVLASSFKFLYSKLCRCSGPPRDMPDRSEQERYHNNNNNNNNNNDNYLQYISYWQGHSALHMPGGQCQSVWPAWLWPESQVSNSTSGTALTSLSNVLRLIWTFIVNSTRTLKLSISARSLMLQPWLKVLESHSPSPPQHQAKQKKFFSLGKLKVERRVLYHTYIFTFT